MAREETTKLLFCTTGILLRKLQLNPLLNGISHIILDEVHERSLESDFLLIILRDVLPSRPDLKVILMSATMNSHMFASYFTSSSYHQDLRTAGAHLPARPPSLPPPPPPPSGKDAWSDEDDPPSFSSLGPPSSSSSSSSRSSRWSPSPASSTRPSAPPSLPPPRPPSIVKSKGGGVVDAVPIVEIPGFTHPVQQFFLEDALEWT
ncbi:hypothetical protein VYU27_010575, partial [Nannochloropsis oceanica]